MSHRMEVGGAHRLVSLQSHSLQKHLPTPSHTTLHYTTHTATFTRIHTWPASPPCNIQTTYITSSHPPAFITYRTNKESLSSYITDPSHLEEISSQRFPPSAPLPPSNEASHSRDKSLPPPFSRPSCFCSTLPLPLFTGRAVCLAQVRPSASTLRAPPSLRHAGVISLKRPPPNMQIA